MKRILVTAGLVAAMTAGWLGANPAEPSDVQDLVFLGGSRPIRIRLHLRIDGRPYRAAWAAYLDQLFDYLDQDGDGVLDEVETERAPKPQFLQQQLRGEPARLCPRGPERRQPAEGRQGDRRQRAGHRCSRSRAADA